jgi:branched-chain amino acid transport system permease protein
MATTVYKIPYPVGIIIGVLISSAAAGVLALLLLRLHGMYFSITTWVIAEALGTFFLSWGYVGKGAGMTVSISPYPRVNVLCVLALILCIFSLIIVFLLLKSKTGLGLTAMRDNISAAASLGVDIGKSRFIVYLIAAVLTAVAGSIFFINKGTIYPESGFSISWTISMVFICIIGGTGTMEGPIVGAIIYVLLQEILAHYPGWSNIFLGIIAILIILYMPDGIVGTIRKKVASRRIKTLNE